jgi:CubicO group peptidase (beta-lactamase class C family)
MRAFALLACVACANSAPERVTLAPSEKPRSPADARAGDAVVDAAASQRRDAEIEALVREQLGSLAGSAGFPAIEVGVYTGGEEYFVGLGQVKPGTPPDEKTLFHIASLTKQFTALLAAQLHVDGVVDLDASVCKDELRALCGEPPATLRRLLTHSTGLPIVPDDTGDGYTIAKLRAFLKRTAPRASAYQYSTTGYSVMAAYLDTTGASKHSRMCGGGISFANA